MQAELIQRLERVEPLTSEAVFVLLWSYFEKQGVIAAETLLLRRGRHFLGLEVGLPGESFDLQQQKALTQLKKLQGEEYDLWALRWLKAADRDLTKKTDRRFSSIPVAGLGGAPYRVRRRNFFLQTALNARDSWAEHQGSSLAAYTRFHMAVPVERLSGYEIDCLDELSWGDRQLHERLVREGDQLQILLWPFQEHPDYPGLDPLKGSHPPTFVSLDAIRNEDVIQKEVRQALRAAKSQKVTLLVFPELTISPATEELICQLLAENGADGYPILTFFGRTHHPNPQGDLDLNEAILLGPEGEQLHCHRKLTIYTGFDKDRVTYFSERIDRGRKVSVLECAIGNLVPLICLDFFHSEIPAKLLQRCHGNLFVVSALSEKVEPYHDSAHILYRSQLASTFVCNHCLDGERSLAPSFYHVPRLRIRQHDSPSPYLLFSLASSKLELVKQQKGNKGTS